MSAVHPVDTGLPYPDDLTADQPPISDEKPPSRRRRTTLWIVLAVLVVAIPFAVWAVIARSGSPAGPAPTAAPTPPATTGAVPSPSAPSPTASSGTAVLPSHYATTRLPKLAGVNEFGTFGYALNNDGVVVGQSEAANGRPHAVLWRGGRVIDLGVLAGGPDESSIAQDINARGDVVGGSQGPAGQRAVLWRDGTMTDLGTLGGTTSFAYAINDRGQIVGTSTTASGEMHGFIWENGVMRDLGLSGMTQPKDINNLGQVVGVTGPTDSGMGQAFLWQNGTTIELPAPEKSRYANRINDSGEIVGGYIVDTASQAVRWHDGVLTRLGTLPNGNAAGAMAINRQGQILGTSNLMRNGMEEHPFIWWRGVMHDLTTAGVPAALAYNLAGINDHGQIIAADLLFSPA